MKTNIYFKLKLFIFCFRRLILFSALFCFIFPYKVDAAMHKGPFISSDTNANILVRNNNQIKSPSVLYYMLCTSPGDPIATPVTDTICSGSAIVSATAAGATDILWYAGSCGGTFVGTSAPGADFSVSPTFTTTYYARGYSGSGCLSNNCASVVIKVGSPAGAVTVSGGGVYCNTGTLIAHGGTGGTIYWQGTTSGGTFTSTPATTQTVTASGTYYFRAFTSVCWGPEDGETITINNIPDEPSPITGPDTVCIGGTVSFSVPTVTGVTSYTWSVPSTGGWAIIAGQNTSTVTIVSGSASGDVCVAETNSCGISQQGCRTITVDPAGTVTAQPGTITGPTNVGSGTAQTYSIAPVTNATSYLWSVPTGLGWVLNSGQGTTSINVTTGTNSGQVCVKAQNDCGNSTQKCLDVACGITENSGLENLNIFPNPNDGMFILDMEVAGIQHISIEIFDVIGNVVYKNNIAEISGKFQKEMDLSRNAKGTYCLQITTDKGVVNKKIILQ